MRKFALVLIILCYISYLLPAQDEDLSKIEMKVTHVAGTVYMLQGAGGNIGASVGEDGIVIVDDQYAPLADKIKAALKGITDKPIRFIINTHYHEDHTSGNAVFQKDAPVIAQNNVRKRLAEGVTAGNLGSVASVHKPQPKEALPILTFDHDMEKTSERSTTPTATPTATASSFFRNRMSCTWATISYATAFHLSIWEEEAAWRA